MANIFKTLAPTDYSITPFPAYYKYSYVYTSGSVDNSEDIQISYAEKYPNRYETRVPNIKYELFDSVMQSFYSEIPYSAYGIMSQSSYVPDSAVWVVGIVQNVFGEKVLPGSFSVTLATSKSYDDGKGNLILSSSGVGSIIGHIFYDKGIALFKPRSSLTGSLTTNGLCIVSGTTLNIAFSSSVTLYENSYKVKLSPSEFLGTTNPSAKSIITGSINTGIELMVSRSLLPYITTIGFYNDDNQLLLVAKPSVPIQRTSDVTQTFIVRYDI